MIRERDSTGLLEAKIEFREQACHAYSIDFSLGCQHRCVYCHFSDEQKLKYRKAARGYDGRSIPLDLTNLLSMTDYPAEIYLSYASDPFAKNVREQSRYLVERLLRHGTRILLITKGVIPENTLELLSEYRDRVHVEQGICSLSAYRNGLLEPGAPSAEARLATLAKLNDRGISTSARLDPMFPILDDTPEDLENLMAQIASTGTRDIVASYVILTRHMLKVLSRMPFLASPLSLLTEETPTVANTPTVSVPFEHKLRTFTFLQELCESKGINFHVCACKDFRLKSANTYLNSCHPRDSAEEWRSFPILTANAAR